MNQFFIPIKAVFGEQTINVLNVDSGLEFLAEDIFGLIAKRNSYSFKYESSIKKQLDTSSTLPKNLDCIRTVLIDGVLLQKQTLSWLALKHVFHQFGYSHGKEFVRWIRKSLSPALALESSDETNLKTVEGIKALSWFFCDSNSCIDSLVSIYQSNLFNFFGIPPSIVPVLSNFCNGNKRISNTGTNTKPVGIAKIKLTGQQESGDLCLHSLQMTQNIESPCYQSFDALQSYRYYLKLLKKQIIIPDYEILHTSDLAARLLRHRYLSSASIVLGFNNLNYFNLYDTFVTSRSDLLLAQELDVAIIFSLKRNPNSYLMLQVIEGGFFLQTLLACTLARAIDKSLSLQIKSAYINWLNYLLVNIKP
ncbi:hypothetical protein CAL7716_100690 (plasmid) [Calothrix sp. PCC 7716]|nr:hypothetical protein CAL7716_100690 [Calothrix sp. PCC 7716]